MATIYRGMALIECADEAHLEELLAGGLERFSVRRLSRNVMQIDHQRLPEVRKLLERLGQTPRVVKE